MKKSTLKKTNKTNSLEINAEKSEDQLLNHPTEAVLATADATDNSAPLELATTPEISKNASLYISIGGGLSAMLGLPRIATWNTLGRPTKPKKGTIGFNTETKKLEVWNGYLWHSVPLTKI